MRRTDRQSADAAFEAATRAAASDAHGAPAAILDARLAHAEHLCLTDRVDTALAALDLLAPELDHAVPVVRAKALAVRGSGLMRRGEYGAAEALLHEAETLLENLSEARPQLASLLTMLARVNVWRGDRDGWGRYARRAVALYEMLDDPAGLAQALSSLCVFLKSQGQVAEALVVGERARVLAALCRDVSIQRDVNFSLVRIHIERGETERVMALLDESEALAPGFENRLVEQNHLAARFYVHQMRAELAEARAVAARLLERTGADNHPMLRVGFLNMVAGMNLVVGDVVAARTLLEESVTICAAQRARGDDSWFDEDVAQYQAWLALAEGTPADALALLPAKALVRTDLRFQQAWIGAAAALALGDLAEARRRLDAVDIEEAAPAFQLTIFLEQRLLLAARERRVDAAARARAEALFADRLVPLLLEPRLRRSLDAAPS